MITYISKITLFVILNLTQVDICFVEISPYKELLDENAWNGLVEQFRQENYRLFQLTNQSVFTVALQAGLSALKTPYPLLHFNT